MKFDSTPRRKFPPWLTKPLFSSSDTASIIEKEAIHTVCQAALCPNQNECYSKKVATFLVLGALCTRSCAFCSIDHASAPPPPDPHEPEKVARAIKALGIRHAVITMVSRDDLADGGAAHLVLCMQKAREENPSLSLEVLTSDFNGNKEALETVSKANPEIFNHNLETVERLSPIIRHKASYRRSLEVLALARRLLPGGRIKSGIMVGLGEKEEEVLGTLADLRAIGCDIVTIGQYLEPKRHKFPVKEFIRPETFTRWADAGRALGIPYIFAAPFVRSSYNAAEIIERLLLL
jgi:lipoic acid synthetase